MDTLDWVLAVTLLNTILLLLLLLGLGGRR